MKLKNMAFLILITGGILSVICPGLAWGDENSPVT